VKPSIDPANLAHLPHLAREAIAAHLEHRIPKHHIEHDETRGAHGVFVTLTTKGERALRGCVGRMALERPSLDDEVSHMAVSAAVADPRFPPVTRDELEDLVVEVSVLGPEEQVLDRRTLDPKRFGVVVRSQGRTGVLLPDIDGVDDVDTQIGIACRKAGIDADFGGFQIFRFEVIKVHEGDEAVEQRGAVA